MNLFITDLWQPESHKALFYPSGRLWYFYLSGTFIRDFRVPQEYNGNLFRDMCHGYDASFHRVLAEYEGHIPSLMPKICITIRVLFHFWALGIYLAIFTTSASMT